MGLLSKGKKRWVEGAIVYQVYPRSFYDSNADGIGDLPGITAKLDYLKNLGVTALWLSPFYPSPMIDFGYDVSDHQDVDPIFGTLKDFDELVTEAHKRRLKILIDLVPNHTSDQHEWFHRSRQSREDKYSDWYIWRDPSGFDRQRKPLPPNNWLDTFAGQTAWEWEPARQQFYLHSFAVQQPDLNWENPEVREAFKLIMRFWLDRGVDGFRIDAVPYLGKDPLFQDDPKNPQWKEGQSLFDSILHIHSQGNPRVFTYLEEMGQVLKEPRYDDGQKFMVVEAVPVSDNHVEEYLYYFRGLDPTIAAPFIFDGMWLPWRVDVWRKFVDTLHRELENHSPLAVVSYAFGNHDQPRLASHRGEQRARASAVMLLTLPGMAFIYNGDEIGMKNGHIPVHMVQDPQDARGLGRDPVRTPMQWSPAFNAGFSKAQSTWLPINDDYPTRNVSSQRRDADSLLSIYHQLCRLRNKSAALKYGTLEMIDFKSDQVFAFSRRYNRKMHIVAVNFSDRPVTLTLPDNIRLGKLQISSAPDSRLKSAGRQRKFSLLPNEAAVFAGK